MLLLYPAPLTELQDCPCIAFRGTDLRSCLTKVMGDAPGSSPGFGPNELNEFGHSFNLCEPDV